MRIAIISFFMATLIGLKAQSYPYWDAPDSLTADDYFYFYSGSYPILATTNALFGFQDSTNGFHVARWTECGGWENLDGLTVGGWPSGHVNGLAHSPLPMTVHDHYLYVVGFFSLDGSTGATNSSDLIYLDTAPYTTNFQIARFDLNTGSWAALGQNFKATNVTTPTTIAIDASNRIYVGFEVGSPEDGNGNPISIQGTPVDMLDVSTNEGASWQGVGGGLVAANYEAAGAIISALYADGTNLYVGGEFSGAPGVISPSITMWTGNGWFPIDGISSSYFNDCGSPDSGLDVVNSIVGIGTNIYVAGGFNSPQQGLARFSNVTGHSLPIGDPGVYLNWATGEGGDNGVSLAVNNSNLYLGGYYGGDSHSYTPYLTAYLSNPTDSNPTSWSGMITGSMDGNAQSGNKFLVSATNGNAVYTFGSYDGIPNGFARWVVGSDGPSPTATISSATWTGGSATLSIYGTAGSHWQIIESTNLTSWAVVGAVTLWSGTATFADPSSYSNQPYYQLTNYCSQSAISPCSDAYTLCITNSTLQNAELYVSVTDGNGDTLISDNIPANSHNCYNLTISANESLDCTCIDELTDDSDETWITPTRQNGGLYVDKGGTFENYTESGGPLCP